MAEHIPNIGHVPPTDATRDAIHFAVIPMVAGNTLHPSMRVGVMSDGRAGNVALADTVGIVDPFLGGLIQINTRFWLFLDPGTITGLRHEWAHPAFPRSGEEKALAESFARQVANKIDLGYDFLMDAADRFAEDPDSWGGYTSMGENESYKQFDDWPEFWRAYEVIRGVKLKGGTDHYAPFSCSC